MKYLNMYSRQNSHVTFHVTPRHILASFSCPLKPESFEIPLSQSFPQYSIRSLNISFSFSFSSNKRAIFATKISPLSRGGHLKRKYLSQLCFSPLRLKIFRPKVVLDIFDDVRISRDLKTSSREPSS